MAIAERGAQTRKTQAKLMLPRHPRFASALEGCQEMSTSNMPTPATHEDNDTRIGTFGRQRQEVVPVGSDQDQTVLAGIIEYLDIAGPNREVLLKFGHLIA